MVTDKTLWIRNSEPYTKAKKYIQIHTYKLFCKELANMTIEAWLGQSKMDV
jgi:hypothetical protein